MRDSISSNKSNTSKEDVQTLTMKNSRELRKQASHTATSSGQRCRKDTFRFLDLPAEIRLQIYRYLIPHGLIIVFEPSNGVKTTRGPPAEAFHPTYWTVMVLTNVEDNDSARVMPDSSEDYPGVIFAYSLIFVSKLVTKEIKDILYHENTFKFCIDGIPHHPISLRSSQIFGPLGLPHRMPLLRNLTHIILAISFDDVRHWVVQRHRARLDHFVNVLKQHADDANQRSLLKHLEVGVTRYRKKTYIIPPRGRQRIVQSPFKLCMFGLESLVALRGIPEVQVTGVEKWFADCLALCMKGLGGEVEELDWPLVTKMRRHRFVAKRSKIEISTRKWYHPRLNWGAFAERNGIEIPGGFERLLEEVRFYM